MKKVKSNEPPYFAEREEQAVIDYINSDSAEEKNRIYNEILIEPFRIISEVILKRYITKKYPKLVKFYTLEELQEEALTH